MSQIQQLLQQRQTQFIEKRANIKSEVDAFLESVKVIDTDMLVGLAVPTGHTAEEVLPSLWEEPFDSNKYATELKNLNVFISQVHELTDKLNQEALECLQQQ